MLSRVRVWLNRTYAENVFFMDQLRRNPSDRAVEIHATHGDADSPVLAAADVRARLDRLGIPLVPPDTVYLGKIPGKSGEKLPPPREAEPRKGGEDKPEDTRPESNG